MLKKILGGSLNARNLMNHLLDVIKSVKPLGSNAANIAISNSLSKTINYINFPKPPNTLKLAQCIIKTRIINRSWYDTQAIARTNTVTCTNQEKESLGRG